MEGEGDKTMGRRLLNILKNNFRGILGFFVTFIAACCIINPEDMVSKIGFVWFAMLWCVLIQPVNIVVVGLFPVFLFPILGVYSSVSVCSSYFDPINSLLVLGGWCLMLFNYSGLTRRGIFWIIGPKDLSLVMLMVRAGLAAFAFSAVSHRLLVTSEIMSLLTPILMNTQTAVTDDVANEIDYNKYRYVLCSVIHTSAAIGSLVFIHSSYTATVAISMFNAGTNGAAKEYFNYMSYVMFTIPMCVIMFIANLLYFIALQFVLSRGKGNTSLNTIVGISKELQEKKTDIAKITTHEWLSIFFWILLHLLVLTRISHFFPGWAEFSRDATTKVPRVGDICIFALFSVILQIMPSSFSFYKYIKANKEDELPPPKPQSSVLEWKFINKNTPYSYILLMGAGVILVRVIVYHRDMLESARNWFRFFKDMSFVGSTFVICIFGVIFCNVMSSIGAAIIYLPSVIVEQTDYPHLSALAAGLSCTFGYMAPFLNTPAYFSKTIGKVPLQYLIMYNVGSSLISTCVLWAMIVALGPSVFPIK